MNAQKTEFIWGALLHAVAITFPMETYKSARDLGVYVDGGMTMRTHINHVLRIFFIKRQFEFRSNVFFRNYILKFIGHSEGM